MVSGVLPFNACAHLALPHHGQLKVRLNGPQEHLAGASQFSKLSQYHSDGLTHSLVWVHFHLAQLVPAIAWRQRKPKFPTLRFGVPGGQTTLAEQTQLIFRHASLKPQKKPVIYQSRIVYSIRVDDYAA